MPSETQFDIEARKRFFRITEEDAERVRGLRDFADDNLDDIVASFYDHLMAHKATGDMLNDEKTVARLRKTQGTYFREMLDGVYDDDYMQGRLRIGRTHHRIGLDPQWYIGAYLAYVDEVMSRLLGDEQSAQMRSLLKIIFLDMSFAIDTYVDSLVGQMRGMEDRFSTEISGFSTQLNDSINRIVSVAAELAATTSQQAATVSQLAVTTVEVRQSALESRDVAEGVMASAEEAMSASNEGQDAVLQALAAMTATQDQVKIIAERMAVLEERMQEVGEIIDSVNEIASQSKLLALNAAIEAARAGSHGRGFAVVAGEIRNLADQSRTATGRVRELLEEVHSSARSAIDATRDGSARAEEGAQLAQKAGKNIESLSNVVAASADGARRIAASSRQQGTAVAEIADAMAGIEAATSQTATALRETEDAARGVADVAQAMNEFINDFRDENPDSKMGRGK